MICKVYFCWQDLHLYKHNARLIIGLISKRQIKSQFLRGLVLALAYFLVEFNNSRSYLTAWRITFLSLLSMGQF